MKLDSAGPSRLENSESIVSHGEDGVGEACDVVNIPEGLHILAKQLFVIHCTGGFESS